MTASIDSQLTTISNAISQSQFVADYVDYIRMALTADARLAAYNKLDLGVFSPTQIALIAANKFELDSSQGSATEPPKIRIDSKGDWIPLAGFFGDNKKVPIDVNVNGDGNWQTRYYYPLGAFGDNFWKIRFQGNGQPVFEDGVLTDYPFQVRGKDGENGANGNSSKPDPERPGKGVAADGAPGTKGLDGEVLRLQDPGKFGLLDGIPGLDGTAPGLSQTAPGLGAAGADASSTADAKPGAQGAKGLDGGAPGLEMHGKDGGHGNNGLHGNPGNGGGPGGDGVPGTDGSDGSNGQTAITLPGFDPRALKPGLQIASFYLNPNDTSEVTSNSLYGQDGGWGGHGGHGGSGGRGGAGGGGGNGERGGHGAAGGAGAKGRPGFAGAAGGLGGNGKAIKSTLLSRLNGANGAAGAPGGHGGGGGNAGHGGNAGIPGNGGKAGRPGDGGLGAHGGNAGHGGKGGHAVDNQNVSDVYIVGNKDLTVLGGRIGKAGDPGDGGWGGARGAMGTPGAGGAKGAGGSAGKPGEGGEPGAGGAGGKGGLKAVWGTGLKAIWGKDGLPGANGASGLKGPQGANGKPGKDSDAPGSPGKQWGEDPSDDLPIDRSAIQAANGAPGRGGDWQFIRSAAFSQRVDINASEFKAKLTISGSDFNDTFKAGSGGSLFYATQGLDTYAFGSGVDKIVYTRASQSGDSAPDEITNFSSVDVIDVRLVTPGAGGLGAGFGANNSFGDAEVVWSVQNGKTWIYADSDNSGFFESANDLVVALKLETSFTLTTANILI